MDSSSTDNSPVLEHQPDIASGKKKRRGKKSTENMSHCADEVDISEASLRDVDDHLLDVDDSDELVDELAGPKTTENPLRDSPDSTATASPVLLDWNADSAPVGTFTTPSAAELDEHVGGVDAVKEELQEIHHNDGDFNLLHDSPTKMEQHGVESFADAVKHGHHEETHQAVYQHQDDPAAYHQAGGGETVVRDVGQYQNATEFASESQPSQQPWEDIVKPAGAHVDFSPVVDDTKERLKNILDTGNVPHQSYGGLEGTQGSFPQNFQTSNSDIPVSSSGISQRRSHGYPDSGPAGQFFPPGNVTSLPKYIQNGTDTMESPLSPMAEFDVEKRRQHSFGHHNNTRPARRSRPLGQHVWDLVFWKNVKDSGVIFTFGLTLLLSLSYFSIISIFAYISMTSLILITSFVLLKQIALAFQQQASEHPFKWVLDMDVVISPEYAHQTVDTILKPLNKSLLRIRNLYLADSLGQTLKLIFVMYILTYVGSWFNLLTLLTIVWVAAFTLPKFYVTYREQIDSVIHVILESLRDLQGQITRTVHRQVEKIRSRRSDAGAPKAGQIRSKEEFEVKSSGGGKVSAKHEKKTAEKLH